MPGTVCRLYPTSNLNFLVPVVIASIVIIVGTYFDLSVMISMRRVFAEIQRCLVLTNILILPCRHGLISIVNC